MRKGSCCSVARALSATFATARMQRELCHPATRILTRVCEQVGKTPEAPAVSDGVR